MALQVRGNSNPTTPGKSRNKKAYCNESMMPAFFDKISQKVDLRLFEELDPSTIHEDFLTRSPLPPATRDLLSEHCRASPNVWRGAAHALCADFVSANPRRSRRRPACMRTRATASRCI